MKLHVCYDLVHGVSLMGKNMPDTSATIFDTLKNELTCLTIKQDSRCRKRSRARFVVTDRRSELYSNGYRISVSGNRPIQGCICYIARS
jgi:hypothetical protein